MTQSALVFRTHPLLSALESELAAHAGHPLCSDAARSVARRTWDRAIGEPLREFLRRPGKEFRGELSKIFFEMVSPGAAPPAGLSLIVEALHAGSLVIDDIEDDAIERRGGPALHRHCGVPLALNAGNWLYFWASELLADLGLPDPARREAHDLMTRSLLDCHYGQALDLSAKASQLPRAELPAIVRATTELKTGSLVALAAGLGVIAGGGGTSAVGAAYRFGRELGSALQMLDDLGCILSPQRLAKAEEDLRNDRPTWPWAWLATSQPESDFRRLQVMATAVAGGADAGLLVLEMRGRVSAEGGRIHDHLQTAFGRLVSAFPRSNGLQALRAELDRLEASYV